MIRKIYHQTRIWMQRVGEHIQTLALQSLSRLTVDYMTKNLGLFLKSQNSDVICQCQGAVHAVWLLNTRMHAWCGNKCNMCVTHIIRHLLLFCLVVSIPQLYWKKIPCLLVLVSTFGGRWVCLSVRTLSSLVVHLFILKRRTLRPRSGMFYLRLTARIYCGCMIWTQVSWLEFQCCLCDAILNLWIKLRCRSSRRGSVVNESD